MSGIRTLQLTPNGTGKLVRSVGAPAYACLCSDVHRKILIYATLFSSSDVEP